MEKRIASPAVPFTELRDTLARLVPVWANALLGADEGKAPFDGIWTNAKYRRGDKTLIPAGLTETPVWKLVK